MCRVCPLGYALPLPPVPWRPHAGPRTRPKANHHTRTGQSPSLGPKSGAAGPFDVLDDGGGGGPGTQNNVHCEWPKSIIPSAIFSRFSFLAQNLGPRWGVPLPVRGSRRAPLRNSAPLVGGGGPPRRIPPIERLGQIFFQAFGQSKICFGAFGVSKNSATVFRAKVPLPFKQIPGRVCVP